MSYRVAKDFLSLQKGDEIISITHDSDGEIYLNVKRVHIVASWKKEVEFKTEEKTLTALTLRTPATPYDQTVKDKPKYIMSPQEWQKEFKTKTIKELIGLGIITSQ